MTGKSGVATAVAAPTMEQRMGKGATLLRGVAGASLRRRAGLSIEDGATGRGAVLWHLCRSGLTDRCDGVAQRMGARHDARRSRSIVAQRYGCAAELAAVETLARKPWSKNRSHCSVIVPANKPCSTY